MNAETEIRKAIYKRIESLGIKTPELALAVEIVNQIVPVIDWLVTHGDFKSVESACERLIVKGDDNHADIVVPDL